MGRPKALLPVGAEGQTFVRRLANTLLAGGIADVVVVGRPEDADLTAEVTACGLGVRYAANHRADVGQLSSIVAGINLVDHPGIRGALVTPVDLPLMSPQTIAALLERFARSPRSILRATFQARHGHPVIFPQRLFDELRQADPAVGAKAVMRAHADAIEEIDVPDPGIVNDIDDQTAYKEAFGRFPQ